MSSLACWRFLLLAFALAVHVTEGVEVIIAGRILPDSIPVSLNGDDLTATPSNSYTVNFPAGHDDSGTLCLTVPDTFFYSHTLEGGLIDGWTFDGTRYCRFFEELGCVLTVQLLREQRTIGFWKTHSACKQAGTKSMNMNGATYTNTVSETPACTAELIIGDWHFAAGVRTKCDQLAQILGKTITVGNPYRNAAAQLAGALLNRCHGSCTDYTVGGLNIEDAMSETQALLAKAKFDGNNIGSALTTDEATRLGFLGEYLDGYNNKKGDDCPSPVITVEAVPELTVNFQNDAQCPWTDMTVTLTGAGTPVSHTIGGPAAIFTLRGESENFGDYQLCFSSETLGECLPDGAEWSDATGEWCRTVTLDECEQYFTITIKSPSPDGPPDVLPEPEPEGCPVKYARSIGYFATHRNAGKDGPGTCDLLANAPVNPIDPSAPVFMVGNFPIGHDSDSCDFIIELVKKVKTDADDNLVASVAAQVAAALLNKLFDACDYGTYAEIVDKANALLATLDFGPNYNPTYGVTGVTKPDATQHADLAYYNCQLTDFNHGGDCNMAAPSEGFSSWVSGPNKAIGIALFVCVGCIVLLVSVVCYQRHQRKSLLATKNHKDSSEEVSSPDPESAPRLSILQGDRFRRDTMEPEMEEAPLNAVKAAEPQRDSRLVIHADVEQAPSQQHVVHVEPQPVAKPLVNKGLRIHSDPVAALPAPHHASGLVIHS